MIKKIASIVVLCLMTIAVYVPYLYSGPDRSYNERFNELTGHRRNQRDKALKDLNKASHESSTWEKKFKNREDQLRKRIDSWKKDLGKARKKCDDFMKKQGIKKGADGEYDVKDIVDLPKSKRKVYYKFQEEEVRILKDDKGWGREARQLNDDRIKEFFYQDQHLRRMADEFLDKADKLDEAEKTARAFLKKNKYKKDSGTKEMETEVGRKTSDLDSAYRRALKELREALHNSQNWQDEYSKKVKHDPYNRIWEDRLFRHIRGLKRAVGWFLQMDQEYRQTRERACKEFEEKKKEEAEAGEDFIFGPDGFIEQMTGLEDISPVGGGVGMPAEEGMEGECH